MADSQELKQNDYAYLPSKLRVLLNILNAEKSGNIKPVLTAVDKDEFEQLAALSSRHKTDYYLFTYFQQFSNLVSSEQLQQLRERMTQQAVKSLQQLSELILLCKNFNQKGIHYAVIKGPHLARMLYGNAAVKVSVDLDFLMVNPGDLPHFHKVFSDAGYSCTVQKLITGNWKQRLFIAAKREVPYYNPVARCAVDLHVRPAANTLITRHFYSYFFSDLEQVPFEGITIPVLPAEKYFVYLCYHGACHQFSRLAWLLDIRNFYNQQKEKLSVEKILATARSINTERSVYLTFHLLNGLFNIEIPEKISQKISHARIIERLALGCLKAISYEKGHELTLRARYDRLVHLIRLNKGIAGKADVLLSVFMRYVVLIFFRRKG